MKQHHLTLPTAHCPLPTAHYPLPTTHYPLPTTHYPLPTTHYPLPTTHYPLQKESPKPEVVQHFRTRIGHIPIERSLKSAICLTFADHIKIFI